MSFGDFGDHVTSGGRFDRNATHLLLDNADAAHDFVPGGTVAINAWFDVTASRGNADGHVLRIPTHGNERTALLVHFARAQAQTAIPTRLLADQPEHMLVGSDRQRRTGSL